MLQFEFGIREGGFSNLRIDTLNICCGLLISHSFLTSAHSDIHSLLTGKE